MSIYEQTTAAIGELYEKANLKEGCIVVVGCSTSEVIGAKIGTNSSPATAAEIFRALYDYTQSHGLFLAIQCCEHLNRAIITERKAVPFAEPAKNFLKVPPLISLLMARRTKPLCSGPLPPSKT